MESKGVARKRGRYGLYLRENDPLDGMPRGTKRRLKIHEAVGEFSGQECGYVNQQFT